MQRWYKMSVEPNPAELNSTQKDNNILAKSNSNINLLDSINFVLTEQFEERLFPCNISRNESGKKNVSLPKGWTDKTKEYYDFDEANSNSIALRTGNGITIIDIDTKDISQLEPAMTIMVEKWLEDKATFIVETTNGYHFYFDTEDEKYSNAVRVSDFVDVRGNGGCVFCYTQDPKSNYEVLCDAEALPLTKDVIEYISLKERDNETTEYTYGKDNIKVALKPHSFNDLMEKGYKEDDASKVLKSAGYEVTDFENTDGLYSRVNVLAFILAMNPAFPNNEVKQFIEKIVTEYCGFDIQSKESQKRLHQIFSSMIYCNEEDKKDMLEILAECSMEIESNLEILHEDLLFLNHGFNLLIGESKSGKTFTTIKSLIDVGLKDNIIHIDFDRNSDKKLEELGVVTYHISSAEQLFKKLEEYKKYKKMDDKIIVIDSLQDLGLETGIDTNSAALDAMKRVAKFGDTGATLIVIHHVTLEKIGDSGVKIPKIKGNSSTISSKTDINLMLTRDGIKRTMAVMYSRAEDIIPSGSKISYNGEHRISGASFEPPA